MSKRCTRADCKSSCHPAKKQKSVRDAWFDDVEEDGFLSNLYESVLAQLTGRLGEDRVAEASKNSYTKICQVLCDELCPGVVKMVEDLDSDEDPDVDEGDDEEEEELSLSEEERLLREEEEEEEEEEMELESEEEEEEEEEETKDE
jgi:hypothetical protein